MVCPADMRNVVIIFIPLSRFTQEIEEALKSGPNSPCTLNTFLSDYVSNVFVKKHHFKVSSAIEAATKAPDAWKSITNPGLTKKMGLSRPLLQVCFFFSCILVVSSYKICFQCQKSRILANKNIFERNLYHH